MVVKKGIRILIIQVGLPKRTFSLMMWRSASWPFTASDICWAAALSELGLDIASMMNLVYLNSES
jgi:hypothetical protein